MITFLGIEVICQTYQQTHKWIVWILALPLENAFPCKRMRVEKIQQNKLNMAKCKKSIIQESSVFTLNFSMNGPVDCLVLRNWSQF